MACDDVDDGCPPGQYKCRPCGGSKGRLVCKPCPGVAGAAARAAAAPPENWAWCSQKGEPMLCVPMAAFADQPDAAAWFVAQGRGARVRIMRVDEPDTVEWGTPS